MRKMLFSSILTLLIRAAYLPIAGQTAQTPEKPLTLNDILSKLTFTSRISKTNEDINEQLILNIRRRGVNFQLSEDNKSSVIEARGTTELIKIIDRNFREEPIEPKLKEKIILYQKFTDNYAGDLRQMKIALAAAREYTARYGQSDTIPEKNIIEYFKSAIPVLERQISEQEPCHIH